MSKPQVKDLTDAEALRAVAEYRQLGSVATPWDILCERWPFKIAQRKLGRLAERGLIDYGVSLNAPWLTDEGKEALSALV